jgi:RNA polymerase sigma factor (sigma-70 family)
VEATSAPRPPALRIPKPRRLLAALSDERLVEQIRRGEPVAFEVLYDRYSTGVLGFCRHMLGSAADAEDALQHTFMSAHADIQRHGKRNLHVKAWLYTIARNRCVSILRARREQPTEEVLEVSTDNLLHDIQHRDDIRALLGDIAKLPDDQREALVLAEVGDLSHSDISEVLGCEASKVKSLVFQARTALIDRRTARETPCAQIREQLATLRGGALRRSPLRHHLEACPGCTEYREQIKRQRAMLALALPVVPSAALKANVLGSLGLGGGSAAAATTAAATATGGGLASTATAGAGSMAAKLGIAAVLAVGGTAGATVANNGAIPLVQHPAPAQSVTPPAGNKHSASASAAHTGTTTVSNKGGVKKHDTTGSRRSASGTEHGFTPITGQSNGARARAFAQTRGKGKETSAAHRHVTAHKRATPVRPVRPRHLAQPRNVTRSQPVRTQPAPAPQSTETTTQTVPAPTTTTTTPTSTQPAPSPQGGGGKGGGKAGGSAGATLQTGATG